MLPPGRAAIGLGDIGPREGRIARHHEPRVDEGRFDPVDHLAPRCRAKTIPQHDIGPPHPTARHAVHRLMRHGMAIDQHRLAMAAMRPAQQLLQFRVIGPPVAVDSQLRLFLGQFAAINRPAIGHHAGNHPQPRGHARVMPLPRNAFDDRRIQLLRRAIEVDIGPRGPGFDKRSAMQRCAVEQEINKGIFGRTDRMFVQNRPPQERRRIIPPRMGRCKNHARAVSVRMQYFVSGHRHNKFL